MADRIPEDFDLAAWTERNALAARIVDGQIVAVVPQTFGKFRLTIGDETFVDRAY